MPNNMRINVGEVMRYLLYPGYIQGHPEQKIVNLATLLWLVAP